MHLISTELSGIETVIVPVLKFIMLGVMIGGGVAVFRELIPMARGRAPQPPAPSDGEQS